MLFKGLNFRILYASRHAGGAGMSGVMAEGRSCRVVQFLVRVYAVALRRVRKKRIPTFLNLAEK